MDFLGIEREAVFSPGKVDADAGILSSVGRVLTARGADVRILTVDEAARATPSEATVVFAMCQGDAALALLFAWEARGIRIVNRPRAVLDSRRHRAIPLLQRAAVALPTTILVDSADPDAPRAVASLGTPAWVKRGDVHATHPDDVARVDAPELLPTTLARFRERGIHEVAVQRHVAGTVHKFYGVAEDFFHCVTPADGRHLDATTLAAMQSLGVRGAAALGLEVYGGDCVCDAHGDLHLVDLNDWPSYGPCRAQGAAAIAAHIHAQKDQSCC